MKKLLIILLCLAVLVPLAHAATDYLWVYSSWFSSDAVSAALESTPVIRMDAEMEAVYRLGFAAGYDTAKEDAGLLILGEDGEPALLTRASLTADADEGNETYIVNTETNKFHIPGCSSEKAILPEHRKEVHGTIEEIRQMGYSPCGRCLKNNGQ